MRREKTVNYPALFLVVLIGAILSFSMTARADTGPKPSVKISFEGIENEIYYVTLLSETEGNGPWQAGNSYEEWQGEKNIWEKFNTYEDADNFYFWGIFEECSETDSYVWGYYPPETFKILLYFPEQDSFLVSGICERYAFDSYFTAQITENGELMAQSAEITVQRSYDYTREIVSLLCRTVITILLELGIAWLFRFRSKKQILVICITNVVTQTILNVLLNVINYNRGNRAFIFHYVWMELLVFVIEGLVYAAMCRRLAQDAERKLHPWIYAFAANVISFAAGLWIANLIPGIF